MLIPITRRYWFWQHKKMIKDDVGFIVEQTAYDKAPETLNFVLTTSLCAQHDLNENRSCAAGVSSRV